MRDGIGTFGDRDIHHRFGDARACDRCPQKIATFVNRIRLDHRENVVRSEVLFEIADETFRGTGGKRFGLKPVELVALADIRAIRDDLRIVFLLEPKQQDRGIKTTRVSDDDFHDGAEPNTKPRDGQGKQTPQEPEARSIGIIHPAIRVWH